VPVAPITKPHAIAAKISAIRCACVQTAGGRNLDPVIVHICICICTRCGAASGEGTSMVGHRKLLVVDDQRDICEVIQCCLAQHSYDVDYATDSPSAKRKLEADTYDLVIIDMLMPGEGDLQLVKFAETQGIPVLLTSGHPEMIAKVAQQFPYPLLPSHSISMN